MALTEYFILLKKEGNSCLAWSLSLLMVCSDVLSNCWGGKGEFLLHFKEMGAARLTLYSLKCPDIRWDIAASCSISFKLQMKAYCCHLELTDKKLSHYHGPLTSLPHPDCWRSVQTGCGGMTDHSTMEVAIGKAEILYTRLDLFPRKKKNQTQQMKTNELCHAFKQNAGFCLNFFLQKGFSV